MKHILLFLSFVLIFSTNLINASIVVPPTFGNTGAITICVNGSYYLNPSTTLGTFSSNDPLIATVNASGYVTGVKEGTTTASLAVTGAGTVTATINVVASLSPSLSITDPLAQPSYKFSNNPQGPIGGINNYVGYNGFSYSSQARSINTGFFRASNQLGDAAGCPFEYYIFRCTTCGTVPEYATRPQGTFNGSTINLGQTGQLTYTSSNGVVGPYTFVYYDGVSNITVNNKSSSVAFNVTSETPINTTSYKLISVTDERTNSSSDFSGTTAIISVGITIGSLMWSGKNLDVTNYRNGDPIPQVTDPGAWAGLTTGAWCYLNNNISNNATYGKLYNWYAVTDPRGLAPLGWHIPTNNEWTDLGFSLGGNSIAGGKMKTIGTNTLGTGLWDSPNSDATNSSEFSGLPGGYRQDNGTFDGVGNTAYWWSITELYPGPSGSSMLRRLQSNDPSLAGLDYNKRDGLSVRLIKGDHYLGESFGGGKVAYILVSGDPGYDANTQHGLVAATSDEVSILTWAGAITACNNKTTNGFDDWYLPSKDELNKLYLNKVNVGGFVNYLYWSSSEINDGNAWLLYFLNGGQYSNAKDGSVRVRAIRSF